MFGSDSFLHVLFGVFAIGALAWHFIRQHKLREAWSAWARAHHWSYDPSKNRKLALSYSFLDRLRQGHSRWLYHRVKGEHSGRKTEAFTFHYAVGHGKHRSNHYFGVVLCQLARDFPEIKIHPENFFHKMGGLVGIKDLDLDSVEFSKTFRIHSEDKKFAYDFCNTGMMEYLLAHRDTALELEGHTLAVFLRGHLKPEKMDEALARLDGLRQMMPGYLFKD